MSDLYAQVQETADALRKRIRTKPGVAVILGTGLGQLGKHVENATKIPYKELPHMPLPTVMSHEGHFLAGQLGGKEAIVMEGRFHRYEGYTLEQVTFPVRVLRELGAKTLIVSNAAGGMNPNFREGDVVIIEDHINLMGDNPLIVVRDERLGPRFADMSEPYDKKLIALAQKAAMELKIPAKIGVYVGVTGPSLETRAEYRFLRTIGADVVGMSTVPENLVAVHMGMKVFGIGIVTDLCLPDALGPAKIEEIIRIANEAEPKLAKIVTRLIKEVTL